MQPFSSRLISIALLIMMTPLLPSCSGTGDSGGSTGAFDVNLSGLLVADRVSVVDPQQSPAPSPKPALLPFLLGAVQLSDLPPASDFLADRVTVYVNERSLESFGTVNEILCMIRQSRYDAMVNAGPYRAQVDKNLCSSSRSDASGTGQSASDQTSGATMPRYENWVVDSSRATAGSPHLVSVWVHPVPGPNDPPQVIHAKLVITEGADTAPPYGIFKANFKALDPNDLSTVLFRGFLNADRATADKVLLHFATEDKDSYIIEKATLDKRPDGSSGAGSAFRAESFPGMTPTATRFNLAYDAGLFLRTENSGTNICLDRTAFRESGWRYGLYTSPSTTAVPAGTRVTRTSNFSVRKGGIYGSIGYWGAWFPNGTMVSDGDAVFKHDYATNTDTPYTVMQAGGKLKRYERSNITLGDIRNVPLVWFDAGTAYLVAWTGTDLIKAAQVDANGSWMTIAPQAMDLGALSWVDLQFWSQSLSGSVIVKLPPPTATPLPSECLNNGNGTFDCTGKANDTVPVIFFKESVVFPGDPVPARLACFERCPDASALDTAGPFFTDVSYQTVTPALATFASYSFDPATMVLTDGASGAPVTAATTTSPFEHGITSGLLTEPTDTNLGLLACPWNSGSTCAGMAWTVLPEFYIWETGPNSWNKFVTVRSGAGMPVRFDPPLQVRYVHSQPTVTAPDHKYDGATFFLEYAGFGDLHGIPGKCVDLDTGADADCSAGTVNRAIRWVPEFTIPAAGAGGVLTELTDVVRPAVTYLVKALEKEQRMGSLPVSTCQSAGLVTAPYVLPSMSSWVNPVIGPEPAVSGAPAVVGGVVQ